jgi:hypothetical protein
VVSVSFSSFFRNNHFWQSFSVDSAHPNVYPIEAQNIVSCIKPFSLICLSCDLRQVFSLSPKAG